MFTQQEFMPSYATNRANAGLGNITESEVGPLSFWKITGERLDFQKFQCDNFGFITSIGQ